MTYNPNQPIQTAAPQAPTGGHRLSYDDRPGTLAKIAFSNALFLIPTLGFYRFWAKTKLRRHFWSSVKLDGESLEYTGTAKELLMGFLVVVAIFVPIIAVVQILQLLAQSNPERYLTLAASAYLAFIIGLFFFVYYAFFSARRYRMSRTLWRGIRGGLDGSPAVYALWCFWAAFLSVITLGIAAPYAEMPATRYIINKSRFGSQSFSAANLSGGPLMKRWLIVLLGLYIFFGIIAAVAAISGIDENSTDKSEASAVFGAFVLFGLLALMLLNFWYAVFRVRYVISQIAYGPVRFASGITTKSVMWIGFIYLLSFIGMIIILVIVGALIMGGFSAAVGPNPSALAVLAIMLIGGLALVGSFVLVPLMLVRPLLKRFIETMVIAGKIDFAQVAQAARGPKRGEGLADVLDVGGL